MPAVERLGDVNSAGGAITSVPQQSVEANGKLVAVNGSSVAPHNPFVPPHLAAKTANGVSTVTINGVPVNTVGNADTCGHPRTSGSPNVSIGG